MPPFRKVGESEVFAGTLIKVANATFEGPTGRFERDVVHHPGAVVVVPLTDGGKVVMVRQFRAAIGSDLLEIPAGKRDVAGEPPEETAARELAEEVGLRASSLELLARFYNSPGFTDELSWLYLATGLSEVPHDRQGHEEQVMSIEEVPLGDTQAMVADGRIIDAKSIIGLTLTALRAAQGEASRPT
ncbi:MAG TPA: NUDIX hydrolase [Acidimicrobiales bacterium]|nr:NUDIX hydrolase [Acidimicrobiales bacterium]